MRNASIIAAVLGALSLPALAQGTMPSGTRAGSPGPTGAPGEVSTMGGALPAARARIATPMIKMIITIKRREGMSHEEFVRHQREIHRPLLASIPEARQYIRRYVVSYPIAAPDYSGPSYDSVVEVWFDNMEDMNALYFSENFLGKVAPDHANFMDLTSYGRIVSEEDVVIE